MNPVNNNTGFESLRQSIELNSNELDELAHSYVSKMKHPDFGGLILKKNTIDQWCLVVRDSSQQGKWRFNVCDRRGFFSHSTYEDAFTTIRSAIENGFCVLCDVDTLDILSKTKEWELGSQRTDLIARLNAGAITFDEFKSRVSILLEEDSSC